MVGFIFDCSSVIVVRGISGISSSVGGGGVVVHVVMVFVVLFLFDLYESVGWYNLSIFSQEIIEVSFHASFGISIGIGG